MPEVKEKRRSMTPLIPPICCLALVLCVWLLAKFPGTSRTQPELSTVPTVTEAATEPAPTESKPVLSEPWALVLVSSSHPLPQGTAEPSLTALSNGLEVDSRIYSALIDMLNGAQDAGLSPEVCSP